MAALVERDELQSRLVEYERKAKGAISPNTKRALKADSAIWSAWCANEGLSSLPAMPDALSAFVDDQATSKSCATVRRYIATIARMHRAASLNDPTKDETVKLAMKRMARAYGTRQDQADALNRPAVDRMIAAAGDRVRDLRNVAMLALQYDTMTRRSELVAIELEDITRQEDGTGTVIIRRSKTDQAGEGAVCFLATDTMERLASWIDAAGVEDGALFRSVNKGGKAGDRLHDRDVPRILKGMAEAAGLDIDPSGHSARVGVAQDMTAAGFGLSEIMQAGRWKSPTMPARYSENQQARRGAAAKLAALQNRF